jgi:putative peptidoglycan lipid II flippase
LTQPTDHDDSHHSFLGSAKIIAACTLLSRALGMVRDMAMAAFFGAAAGPVSDAFFTAWRIPNLFRRLFGEGAVSSALVPTFTESIKARDDVSTQALFSVTFTIWFIFLAALTLVLEAVILGLSFTTVFGERTQLLLKYATILSPYMLLICLAAFFIGVLNAHRHFFAPAVMPAMLNVTWIAALAAFFLLRTSTEKAGAWLSVAVLVGGLIQVLMQVPYARHFGVRLRPSLEVGHPGFRQILGLMGPVILGSAVVQINTLVDGMLAYYLVPGRGAATYLFYGNRLDQFPLAIIGVAISTAVLTPLSEHAAANDLPRFKRTLASALRMTLFLGIPSAVGLMTLCSPIVEVIYQRKAFTSADTLRTAWVLFYYGMAVWAHAGVFVILRAFYALKDTRTPPKVAAWMVLLNLVLNLTFVWPLKEGGLALATSLCGGVQLAILILALRKRIGLMGARGIVMTGLKTTLVSLAMGAAAFAGWYWLWPTGGRTIVRLGMLVALLVAAVGIFIGGSLLLRMPELKQIMRLKRTSARP